MQGAVPCYSRPAACGQIMRSILVKGYEQAVLATFAANGRQLKAPHTPHGEDILSVGGLVGSLQRQIVYLHPASRDILRGESE